MDLLVDDVKHDVDLLVDDVKRENAEGVVLLQGAGVAVLVEGALGQSEIT